MQSPQGHLDAERRISELIALNNSLRQENQSVKEEIFDLKMCMATTEVEITNSIKKELDALKSQMNFKEREMQELQRDATLTKRKLQEVTQQASKRQHTSSTLSASASASSRSQQQHIPSERQNTPLSTTSHTQEQIEEARKQWQAQLSAENKRRADDSQQAQMRAAGLAAQTQLQGEQVHFFCADVSRMLTKVAVALHIPYAFADGHSDTVAVSHLLGASRASNKTIGETTNSVPHADTTYASRVSSLQALLHLPPPSADTSQTTDTPEDTQSTRCTPFTHPTQPSISPQILNKSSDTSSGISRRGRFAHKYCTVAPSDKPSTASKHPSTGDQGSASEQQRSQLEQGSETEKAAEARFRMPKSKNVEEAFVALQTCHHRLLQAAVTDQLCPLIPTTAPPTLTAVDELLYALVALSHELTHLAHMHAPKTQSNNYSPSDPSHGSTRDVLYALDVTLSVIRRLLFCFSFRLPLTNSSPSILQPNPKEGQRHMNLKSWRTVIPNSHMVGQIADTGSSASTGTSGRHEGMSELDGLLAEVSGPAIVRDTQLGLVTLGADFRLRCVEPLSEVCDYAFQNLFPEALRGMSDVIAALLQLSTRFLLAVSGDSGQEERHDPGGVVRSRAVARALQPLFTTACVKGKSGGYNWNHGILPTFFILDKDTPLFFRHKCRIRHEANNSAVPSLPVDGSASSANGIREGDEDSTVERVSPRVPSDWLLKLFPLSHRGVLLASLTHLLNVNASSAYQEQERGDCSDDEHEVDVFSVFYNQQMKLSQGLDSVSESSVSEFTTRSPGVSGTLPLPPAVVAATARGGKGNTDDMGDGDAKMRETVPLLCEELMECAYQLASVPLHRQSSARADPDTSLQESTETYRSLIIQLCVTLLRNYKGRGAQCLLGPRIITPPVVPVNKDRRHGTNGSSKSERKQVLIAFGQCNQPAVRTLKLLVGLCWESVLAMDNVPVSMPQSCRGPSSAVTEEESNGRNSSSVNSSALFSATNEDLGSTASTTSAGGYYRHKATLIRDCSVLFELIHACVCTSKSRAGRGGGAKPLSLAELTRVAGSADLFANLLFRIYKRRVHRWVEGENESGDGGAFEGVMDVYDEG